LTKTAATQKTIDDLCWIDDRVSTAVSASSHHESQNSEALRTIYNTSFAPGLDRLLETRWFSADGYMSLSSDRSLLTQFENYVAAISTSPSVVNQEARLVWALLGMCRRRPLPGFAGEFINDKEDTFDGDEVAEKRLDIIEALITGRQLASNPLAEDGAAAPVNPNPPTLAQQVKTREQNFWLHVGRFVSASGGDAVERILSKSRKLLDNFENRDVIYSIMLMRHIGERWNNKQLGEAEDERDRKDWLAAKGFLASEAAGKAMSLVMKRFCSMALRAWSI
jgi:white-opaque regulator 2